MPTRQELLDFFEWADKRGLAFGELVEQNGQQWFHEKVGSRLVETVDQFIRQQEIPPKPDYEPFGNETSAWWSGNLTQEAV